MLRDRRDRPTVRPQVERLEDRTVPTILYGVTDNNVLLRFDSAAPGTIQSETPISGLVTNERIAGIDFRPRTGQLYGVGVVDDILDAIRTYTINPLTGVATRVGPVGFPVGGGGDVYSVDFDPIHDEIRVVNDADENLVINPNTGARADVPSATDLNSAGNHIHGIAYDRSFETGNSSPNVTTLYAIRPQTSTLVTIGGINQNPGASGGTVENSQGLGITVDPASPVGFDVPAGSTNGFATLRNAGTDLFTLYSIQLSNATTTLLGVIGDGTDDIVGLAAAPSSTLVTGTGPGVKARVRVFDGVTGALRFEIVPYGNFKGGVHVAAFAAFGRPLIAVVPGPGAARPVRFFLATNGQEVNPIGFLPFGTKHKRGLYVAAGLVDPFSGLTDLVVGADRGGPARLSLFGNLNINAPDALPFAAPFPFGKKFRGGLRLATADFDNDGASEIVVASGAGRRAQVKVFDNTGQLFTSAALPAFKNSLFPFGKSKLGVYVAAGDVNGDGSADIITGSGAGGKPSVKVFSGVNGALLGSFLAYERRFKGGVTVGLADINGDGRYEIRTAPGAGRPAEVRTFDGVSMARLGKFRAYGGFQGGAFVSGVRT